MNWGHFYEKIFLKKSHNAGKSEREDTLVEKKIREKSHNAEKNLNVNGGPLGSPGNVCYAEKRKNHFGSVP